MKQRGRSPVPKPSRPGEASSSSSSGLRAGGASSKSLTTELLHELGWDDSSGGSDAGGSKDETSLVSLTILYKKLSRGEICVASFIPPCEWCKSG